MPAVPSAAYKPTRAELTAIREGEAAIANRDYVSLEEFLDGDRPRREASDGGCPLPRDVSED